MHSSGALLLEENENHMLQANDKLELEPAIVQRLGLTATPGQVAASLPFGSPRGILLHNLQQSEAAQQSDDPTLNIAAQLEDAFDAMGGGGGDGFDDDDHENEMEHKYDDPEPAASAAAAVKKSVRFADEDEEHELTANVREPPSEEDLWAQLDPHDNGAVKPRPYRRGVTTRKPHVHAAGALTPDLQLHMQHAMRNANPAQAFLLRAIAKNSVNVRIQPQQDTLALLSKQPRSLACVVLSCPLYSGAIFCRVLFAVLARARAAQAATQACSGCEGQCAALQQACPVRFFFCR
jgi:hypothetical protein